MSKSRTKNAAELLREVAARDPEAHARALGRGYVGPADPHTWRFWGDDPYLKCKRCGEIRDALTGNVVRVPVRTEGASECGPDD